MKGCDVFLMFNNLVITWKQRVEEYFYNLKEETMRERFVSWRLTKFEKKMKKLKPQLLSKWYDQQEEKIRLEYEEELDKSHMEVYELNQTVTKLSKERDNYKGKYEALCEQQDKLLNKIEEANATKGELKQNTKQLQQENKQLKSDIQEIKESQPDTENSGKIEVAVLGTPQESIELNSKLPKHPHIFKATKKKKE